ncbi:MAG: hypothetical protein NVS3B7_01320 [Candidatus Elarobacter sp.]
MLVNAVIYTFPEDKADAAEAILRELRDASLREAGCFAYEIVRADADNPGTIVLFEKYRDRAALDAHMREEHFVRLGVNGFRPLATGRRAITGTLVE